MSPDETHPDDEARLFAAERAMYGLTTSKILARARRAIAESRAMEPRVSEVIALAAEVQQRLSPDRRR